MGRKGRKLEIRSGVWRWGVGGVLHWNTEGSLRRLTHTSKDRWTGIGPTGDRTNINHQKPRWGELAF